MDTLTDLKSLPPGIRAVVTELAEDPSEGITKNVELETQHPPDVESLKPHDVLIAIKSAGVSWVDILMTSGQYQHMPKLPYAPGLEYSGQVVWTGSDVAPEKVAIGDSVYVDGFQVGPRTSGDYQQYGGFASYGVAPANAVLPLPHGFNFDQACNFNGSYETAYHCLVACGNVQPGETILIHGASGATGLASVQLAKILGATVIATGRNEAKLGVVKEHGADHVLAIGREDGAPGVRQFRHDVKELTGGKGVDVVYDCVGGDISLESLRCVKFGARFLIVGWAATPTVAKGKGGRGAPNANVLPTNLIMMKGLQVLGCPMVISTQKDPTIRPPRVAQLGKWASEGRLSPHISHVFPLEEAVQALQARWKGKVIGGCVVRPPQLDGLSL
jgi:NADPH:quinone reductase